MSAIASFYLLDISRLDGLRQNAEIIVKKGLFGKKITDKYWDYLENNATVLKGFDGSGYVFANLLIYLKEEKEIDLLTSQFNELEDELVEKRGSSHILFTHEQKKSVLPKLALQQFSVNEIRKFNEEFSQEGDAETAESMLDAIKLLQENLAEIQNDNQVLLLIAG